MKKYGKHYDFSPLILALKSYANNCYQLNNADNQQSCCKNVGGEQRNVPAHVAVEYCQIMRPFRPIPKFNEKILPYTLKIADTRPNIPKDEKELSWFPLSNNSGIGVDFAIVRSHETYVTWRWGAATADYPRNLNLMMIARGYRFDGAHLVYPESALNDAQALTALNERRHMEIQKIVKKVNPEYKRCIVM